MSTPRAQPRLLPRASREIAPVIWDLTGWAHWGDAGMLESLRGHWFFIPLAAHLPEGTIRRISASLPPDAKLVIAMTAEELQTRRGAALKERLAALNRPSCEAVLLDETSPGEIKAGGPFHRLSQLRDHGLVNLYFISAPDYPTAEWMLHHTPAHAVCIPFGVRDQLAKHRLLDDAKNFGTGVIARLVVDPVWSPPEPIEIVQDLSFIAAESDIASMLVPVELAALTAAALSNPMPTEQHAQWWERFQKAVPAPALPTRNLPPEFG